MESGQVTSSTAVTEVTIDVPWGHISGKVWGSLKAPPVLCVHGIQDNANTFDHLIPLLPSSFCYIAIDLPGHGRSSHFPPGLIYTLLEYCMSINRVVNHFGWKQFTYIGHSFGGQIGVVYASFYPEQVSKLVVLDSVISYRDIETLPDHITGAYSKLYQVEMKISSKSPPSYTEEEALRRLTDGRPSILTREAAQALFSRGVIKSGEGYAFSADQRLKFGVRLNNSKEEVLKIISRIQCPTYLFRASETHNAGSGRLSGNYENFLHVPLGNKFQYKLVKGSHDVHLLHPERFAKELFNFLIEMQSSL